MKYSFLSLATLTLLFFASTTAKVNAISGNDPFKRIEAEQNCGFAPAINTDDNSQNNQKAETYCKRSLLYIRAKKFERAIDSLNKAIEIDPSYAESYMLRGALYLQQQQAERAIADLNRAVEIAPNYTQPYIFI